MTNEDDVKIEWINRIADEVERLQRDGHGSLKYRDWLEANYGTRDYSTLDISDMKQICKFFKKLTPQKLLTVTPGEQIWFIVRRK